MHIKLGFKHFFSWSIILYLYLLEHHFYSRRTCLWSLRIIVLCHNTNPIPSLEKSTKNWNAHTWVLALQMQHGRNTSAPSREWVALAGEPVHSCWCCSHSPSRWRIKASTEWCRAWGSVHRQKEGRQCGTGGRTGPGRGGTGGGLLPLISTPPPPGLKSPTRGFWSLHQQNSCCRLKKPHWAGWDL